MLLKVIPPTPPNSTPSRMSCHAFGQKSHRRCPSFAQDCLLMRLCVALLLAFLPAGQASGVRRPVSPITPMGPSAMLELTKPPRNVGADKAPPLLGSPGIFLGSHRSILLGSPGVLRGIPLAPPGGTRGPQDILSQGGIHGGLG